MKKNDYSIEDILSEIESNKKNKKFNKNNHNSSPLWDMPLGDGLFDFNSKKDDAKFDLNSPPLERTDENPLLKLAKDLSNVDTALKKNPANEFKQKTLEIVNAENKQAENLKTKNNIFNSNDNVGNENLLNINQDDNNENVNSENVNESNHEDEENLPPLWTKIKNKELVKTTVDTPKATIDTPKAMSDTSKTIVDTPKTTVVTPKTTADFNDNLPPLWARSKNRSEQNHKKFNAHSSINNASSSSPLSSINKDEMKPIFSESDEKYQENHEKHSKHTTIFKTQQPLIDVHIDYHNTLTKHKNTDNEITQPDDVNDNEKSANKNNGTQKEKKAGRLDPVYRETYVKFKKDRKNKADGFNLQKDDENDDDVNDEKAINENKTSDEKQSAPKENRIARIFNAHKKYKDEYTDESQYKSVIKSLRRTRRIIRRRIFLMSLLTLCSVFLTVCNGLNIAPGFLNIYTNPEIFLWTSFSVLALGALISLGTITGGVGSFCIFRADRDSLFSFLTVSGLVQMFYLAAFAPYSIANPKSNVHIYVLIIMLMLLFNAIGKRIIISRVITNFLVITEQGEERYSSNIVYDEKSIFDLTKGLTEYKGSLAVNRKTDFLSNFMHISYSEDLSDKISRILSPIAFVLSIAFLVLSIVQGHSIEMALTIQTAVFIFSCPLAFLFPVNYPLWQGSKKISPYRAVVAGYDAAHEMSEVNTLAINSTNIFPAGYVVIKGMKSFSNYRIDEAILNTASILYHSDSILSDAFMKIIMGRKDLLKEVDTVLYEDLMGISAWIKDKKVLIGNRDLMIHHNIEVPSENFEKRNAKDGCEFVYLATDGSLSALFIVELLPSPYIEKTLREVYKNSFRLTIKSVDSILTREKIGEIFDIDNKMFKILPSQHHVVLEEETKYTEKLSSAVCNNGSFTGFVKSVITAKKLKDTVFFGMSIMLASVIFGLVILSGYVLTNSIPQLDIQTMLIYQGIFTFALMVFLWFRNKQG